VTDGIHVPREVADAEGLPDELDANIVGPYRFPDPRRRGLAGWMYVGGAAVLTGLAITVAPLYWVSALLVAVLAVWHFRAAWPLEVDQETALQVGAAMAPFAVGHASAAVTFHGVRSRPQWSVIMYSADDPPSRRALVRLDAITGQPVAEVYTEDVPA
jgi:hypothetical protein